MTTLTDSLALTQAEQYAISRIEQATAMLAEAQAPGQVKDIRDKAEAIRLYLRQQSGGLRAQNHAAVLKLRAERKLGEMLAETVTKGGDPKLQTATLAPLGIEKTASHRWQTIARLPEPEFEEYVGQADTADWELTSADAFRLAKRFLQGDKPPAPPPPEGQYRCIVIDPPWPIQKIERDKFPNQGPVLDYPVMGLDEIEALNVSEVSAPDGCHLYLWATQKYVPEAIRLVAKWGFNYQCLMTWVKPTGFTPFSWMYNTEHVVFASRGGLELQRLGLKLSFEAPVTRHSEKPDVFYDLVRQASPEPRLEYFARKPREGFTVWGNEVPNEK